MTSIFLKKRTDSSLIVQNRKCAMKNIVFQLFRLTPSGNVINLKFLCHAEERSISEKREPSKIITTMDVLANRSFTEGKGWQAYFLKHRKDSSLIVQNRKFSVRDSEWNEESIFLFFLRCLSSWAPRTNCFFKGFSEKYFTPARGYTSSDLPFYKYFTPSGGCLLKIYFNWKADSPKTLRETLRLIRTVKNLSFLGRIK